MKKKIKGVEETEAIRAYITKDKSRTSGVMYKIEPPRSVRFKFDKRYSKGCWVSNEKELWAVYEEIKDWKLAGNK